MLSPDVAEPADLEPETQSVNRAHSDNDARVAREQVTGSYNNNEDL